MHRCTQPRHVTDICETLIIQADRKQPSEQMTFPPVELRNECFKRLSEMTSYCQWEKTTQHTSRQEAAILWLKPSRALHKIGTLSVKGRSHNWCPLYLIKPHIVQQCRRQGLAKAKALLFVWQLQQKLNHKPALLPLPLSSSERWHVDIHPRLPNKSVNARGLKQ